MVSEGIPHILALLSLCCFQVCPPGNHLYISLCPGIFFPKGFKLTGPGHLSLVFLSTDTGPSSQLLLCSTHVCAFLFDVIWRRKILLSCTIWGGLWPAAAANLPTFSSRPCEARLPQTSVELPPCVLYYHCRVSTKTTELLKTGTAACLYFHRTQHSFWHMCSINFC